MAQAVAAEEALIGPGRREKQEGAGDPERKEPDGQDRPGSPAGREAATSTPAPTCPGRVVADVSRRSSKSSATPALCGR